MSVRVGDIVRIDSLVLANAIERELLTKNDIEARVNEIYLDETGIGKDVYTIEVKLPVISVFEDEVTQFARRARR